MVTLHNEMSITGVARTGGPTDDSLDLLPFICKVLDRFLSCEEILFHHLLLPLSPL